MRKITRDALEAFRYGRSFKRGNTIVTTQYGPTHSQYATRLYLHGYLIAKMERSIFSSKDDVRLIISTRGYKTNVTKERLNGIPGVNIVQKDFKWYLNGREWNGEWIDVRTQKTPIELIPKVHKDFWGIPLDPQPAPAMID